MGLILYPKIITKIIDVSPKVAEEFLKFNTMNRLLTKSHINHLAQIMKQGDWELTGENIIIAPDGTLLNGQHRLYAIIKSGKTVQICFIFGIDKKAFSAMDTGKIRNATDVISIEGFIKDEAQILSSLIKLDVTLRNTGNIFYNNLNSSMVNPKSIQRELNDNPIYIDSADFISKYPKKTRIIGGGHLAFLHYRFCQIDPIFSPEWLHGLIKGVGLEENDYRLWIRNRLWRNQNSTTKLNVYQKDYLVIRAWYWAVKGRNVKREGNLNPNVDSLKYISLPSDLKCR